MFRRLAVLFLLSAFFIAACGPKATPTPNLAEVQATAISMAMTMAAQTLAAMPTNTPLPTETPTPLPTATPTFAIPTPVIPPTNTPAASGDPCNTFLRDPVGPKTTVIIRNISSGTVQPFSLYLYKSPVGECGFIPVPTSYSKGDSATISAPAGCYFATAYVKTKKAKTRVNGDFCIGRQGQWEIFITDVNVYAKID